MKPNWIAPARTQDMINRDFKWRRYKGEWVTACNTCGSNCGQCGDTGRLGEIYMPPNGRSYCRVEYCTNPAMRGDRLCIYCAGSDHPFKEKMPSGTCPVCSRATLEYYPDQERWRCHGGRCHSEFYHDDDGTINVRDFDPNFDIHGAFIIRRNWPTLVHLVKQWWKQLRTPKPPVKFELKSEIFDLSTEIARIEAEDRQSFAYNPYAIWLAPDRWDGSPREPFWMRDHQPVWIDDDTLLPNQLKPPTLYHRDEDKEFAEFYNSKYKTLAAFRRAKTMKARKA